MAPILQNVLQNISRDMHMLLFSHLLKQTELEDALSLLADNAKGDTS